MFRSAILLCSSAFLVLSSTASAGLYYSGETFAELPSEWRGFLLDQRILRNIAVPGGVRVTASPARIKYEEEAARLQRKAQPTADEAADLGALYVRLGEPAKALTVLRAAQREHPNHFAILANLGTAWQLQGDLSQAASCLQMAVRLAPGKYQKAEEYHLKLVRLRLQTRGSGLDDLFGVRYSDAKGEYEPGKMADHAKLPAHAIAITQQLALWLPGDARLLWQLAELANAIGDVKTAAAMMDGCVTQFGLNDPELRRHRQLTRAAADRLHAGAGTTQHVKKTAGTFKARSKRPLVTRLEQTPLPAISDTGINALPWDLLAQTTVDAKFRPTFPQYFKDLDGKEVSLNGYMQPLRDDPELAAFMFIEYPVGCWYCEMPETVSIVYVELPRGKSVPYRGGLVRVRGRLQLNANDPEDFLYAVRQARVGEVD